MLPLLGPTPGQDLQAWVDERMAIIPFSRMAGMTATAVDREHATLALPARPEWCGDPERNRIHTGMLCALADTACGFAASTAVGEAGAFATLDLRMDYLRSADAGGGLLCHAHCHRVSRSVAFVSGEVRQPGCEDPIALVTATFMRTASGNGPRGLGALPSEAVQASGGVAFRPALPGGRSPYVDFLGVVQLPEAEAGPVFRLPFREDLIGNPRLPAVHGGVLAGFGETAMILHLVATNPTLTKGIPKAVDFAIDYLRPARPVDTYAQALTIRLGNRVSLVQANLWQEDPRRPVAATRGHWLMAR